MALEAARGGRRGTRPGWRARRGLEGIGPRGAAWDPGGVTERRGGLCPQVPELEKATVRIQRPERVMAIIRAIKEQGMNKLQVLALFGFGGGGAGPAGSGRWMHRPRVPSWSSAAPPALARLLPAHVQGPATRSADGAREAPDKSGGLGCFSCRSPCWWLSLDGSFPSLICKL